MLSFSRKTDYALIALAHLAGRAGEIASAREIAETYHLSVPLVMKILKVLTNKAIVRSVRGVKGGYQLGVDLQNVSLYHLIEALKGMEPADNGVGVGIDRTKLFREAIETTLPTEPPLLAVHSKLMRLLKVRPIQFCMFLKALVGNEEMERLMTQESHLLKSRSEDVPLSKMLLRRLSLIWKPSL